MVEKFEKILRGIEKDKGAVSTFAVVKMDEITDKWSVIFSASWLAINEGESDRADFDYLKNFLIKNLSGEESESIARIGLFSMDSHLVKKIHELVGVVELEQTKEINDEKLNGNFIHEGYVFKSA